VAALSRNLDADTLEAISAVGFFHSILVYIDWPDSPVFVHSGVGDLDWADETWRGIGGFGSITLPEEGFADAGLMSMSGELRLVGAPDLLDAYLSDPVRNRKVRVLFGATTTRAGNVLIGEPFEIFSGYVDAMRDVVEVSDGQARRDLILAVVGGPSQRSYVETYHTAEDQARAFPGDTAGEMVINSEAEGAKLRWPA